MIPDRDHFGVQYDPSNAIVAGDDPIALLRAVADRVVSMHASDRYLAEGATLDDLRQTDGTLGYSPNLRHGVTGKGSTITTPSSASSPSTDYRGWISIEDGMNGMDEMAESLAFLRRMSANVLSGLRLTDGPSAHRSGRLRQGRPDPRPGPGQPCPSRNSSPSATSTSSVPRPSRLASMLGRSTT